MPKQAPRWQTILYDKRAGVNLIDCSNERSSIPCYGLRQPAGHGKTRMVHAWTAAMASDSKGQLSDFVENLILDKYKPGIQAHTARG